MTNTAKVEIRTSDATWAASRPAGRDGRVVADVTITGRRVTNTGTEMVFYTFIGEHPDDVTPHGFAPVEWVVD